jgi:uncharacterized protein YjiS (DUF1127 family)
LEAIMRNRIDTIDTIPAAAPGASARFGGAVVRAAKATVGLLVAWQQRARERHALTGLDEHGLRDLGLTRVDVMVEMDKPFWRP